MSPLSAEALVLASSWELAGSGERTLLSLLFGAVVGLSLGLTGGGGSIFAVPLLVYGLAVRPREAVGVSLAAVGATALVGGLRRLARGEVEVRTGLLFAVAGMLGAPAGSWLGRRVPEAVLLALFAGLMVLVAVRMWLKASRRPEEAAAVRATVAPIARRRAGAGLPPRPEPGGSRLTSRCFAVLVVAGLATGVLSGLFGVGGGFVVVPALVLFTGMGIHRAVATSLLVIALVSASGVASYLAAGRPLPLELTGLFVARRGRRAWDWARCWAAASAAPACRRSSPSAMVAVAAFIVVKTPRTEAGGSPSCSSTSGSFPAWRSRPTWSATRRPSRCAVIDPTRDVDEYLEHRQGGGAADHARPGDPRPRRLRQRLGRTEGPPRRRAAGRRLRHGRQGVDAAVRRPGGRATATRSASGSVRLKAIHTPGHTPEHVAWALFDDTRSKDTPWLLFTGDFLFVGDVGRPDLLGEEAPKELAHQLYESVFEKLPPLPDFTEVFPGHGAGSLCGKAIGSRRSSTRRLRAAVQPGARGRSPSRSGSTTLLKGMPLAPPYFRRMKKVNAEGPKVLGPELPGQKRFTAKEVHERLCEHCLVVDVRPKEAFAAAHVPGSINIPLGQNLPTWAGWVLPYDKPDR